MKCPGQDSRYWKGDAIYEMKCPHCGATMEFFKDDPMRRCSNCGKQVPNPRLDFGCATYCPYAKECLGTITSGNQELQQNEDNTKNNRDK